MSGAALRVEARPPAAAGRYPEKVSLDDDLQRVSGKMAALPPRLDPQGRPSSEPVAWRPPCREAEAAAWEAEHGVALPADYRAFITRVAGSGDWPHCGLIGLDAADWDKTDTPDPAVPFPFSPASPLTPADETAYRGALRRGEADRGWIPLCTEGCGMDTVLVVTAVDPGTAGTVWYVDVAHDCGVLPMVHPATGAPLRFLEWFELCLDAQAAGEEEPCGSDLVPPGFLPW